MVARDSRQGGVKGRGVGIEGLKLGEGKRRDYRGAEGGVLLVTGVIEL